MYKRQILYLHVPQVSTGFEPGQSRTFTLIAVPRRIPGHHRRRKMVKEYHVAVIDSLMRSNFMNSREILLESIFDVLREGVIVVEEDGTILFGKSAVQGSFGA